MSATPSTMPDLAITRNGNTGCITLDRPKALNALSADMCGHIIEALRAWADDPAIAKVLITASAGRAFCAGGDIRELVARLDEDEAAGDAYLAAEYQCDMACHLSPKPVVVIADGLTMGGGAGVLLNAAYPIVTTAIDFAMPECAIGLYPDVAASLFLRRAPQSFALFLGLTGWRIGGGDMRRLGIAPRVIDTARAGEVAGAVIACEADALAATLDGFALDPDTATAMQGRESILPHADWIEAHFGNGESPAAIRAGLDGDDSPLAEAVRDALDTRCPVSLAVTHRLFTDDVLAPPDPIAALGQDYRLATRMIRRGDFREGVRAAVIDKTRDPKWQPATLDKVTDAMINAIVAADNAPQIAIPQIGANRNG